MNLALAIFFTLACGIAASERVADDWDPDEGLPTWPTIAMIGMFALGFWIAVAAGVQ